jgi:DNA modification methylase
MQTHPTSNGIGKRADYTFKYNSGFGRHGWLRLTPAYSVKLVRELIREDCCKKSRIIDPFSGTATTGLVAAEMGFDATLFDINPFLIWLGNTKCYHFSVTKLSTLKDEFLNCINNISISNGCWIPPIHNIERWWHRETLIILAAIRESLVNTFGEPGSNFYHNLVWVAFSRLIIETSSAAFNHVSMSFKEQSTRYELTYIKNVFKQIFLHIVSTAQDQLKGDVEILKVDSKELSCEKTDYYDTVITSPPYPNRISYIRELRPYMYWVKFLHNGSDAGTLDWEAIGGTWGTATSKLKNWKPVNKNLPERLYTVCNDIQRSGDKHSDVMSFYVHKYFDDMYSHLQKITTILKPDAKLNYIVGNSSFYGHFVDTENIIAESMKDVGYKNITIQTIRKRNTNKGLFEFNVKARLS